MLYQRDDFYNHSSNHCHDRKEHCGHCGSHDHCKCNSSNHHHGEKSSCNQCGSDHCKCFKKHDEGALVEKVVCSKSVQKTAEFLLPAAIGPLGPGSILDFLTGLVPTLVNATVTPDLNNIQQEVTVIKDKIINLGFIPATLDIDLAGTVFNVPIRIFFQEHTDCPGACPGDTVTETPPVVEAVLNQPLLGTDSSGGLVVNLLLFKAILRTHITVTRRGIVKNGKFCDLDDRRCEQTGPITINSPQRLTPNTSPIGGV